MSTRASRGVLYLGGFAGAAVATGLGRAVVTTYLPLLLQQVRDAPGLIGTVLLVNAASGFVVPLVVGRWQDRRREGARLPLLTGGAIVTASGLVAVALGSGTTYLVLTAAGAVAYVGLNVVTTAYRALVPVLFEAERRARANSTQEVATLVGTLAGIAVGGALTEVAVWAPFVLAAALVPVLTVATVLTTGEARGHRAAQAPALGYYVRAATRPGVRMLLTAQVLWVLAYAALPAFFVLYAKEVLDLQPSVASIALAAFGIATGIAIVAGGRVRDPSWHKPLVALGVALMGGGFLAVSLTSDLVAAALALAPAAVGFGLITALGFPLFATLIPAGEEGGYTALFFSSRAIASAVALPAAGWLIEATESYRALFVLGGVAALAALVPLAYAPVAGSRELPIESRRVRVVLGVAALWAATLAFGLLFAYSPLEDADRWLFRRINEHGTGSDLFWDVFNPHIRNYLLLGLTPFVLALWTRRYRPLPVAAFVIAAAAVSLLLLYSMYAVWDRPRPEDVFGQADIELRPGHSYSRIASYPSGHLVVTAALAAAATRLFPVLRAPVWAYVAVIGFSRVLFGSHFPSDVVGGTVLGFGSAYFVWLLARPTRATDAVRPGGRATPLRRRSPRRRGRRR